MRFNPIGNEFAAVVEGIDLCAPLNSAQVAAIHAGSARPGPLRQFRSRQFPASGIHLERSPNSGGGISSRDPPYTAYDLIASTSCKLIDSGTTRHRRSCSSRPMTWGGPLYSPSSGLIAATKGPELPRRRMRKLGL
jgi:hypothetical protein